MLRTLLLAMLLAAPAQAAEPDQSPQPAVAPPQDPTSDAPEALVDTIESWLEWAARGHADLSTLYGLPTAADRAAVDRAGKAIIGLATRTIKSLDAAIDANDKAAAQNRPTPQSEEAAAKLINQRTTQMPLRLARALLFRAAVTTDASERARLAKQAGTVAAAVEQVSHWSQVERAIIRAMAMRFVNDPAAADCLLEARAALTDESAPVALKADRGPEYFLAAGTVIGTKARPEIKNAVKSELLQVDGRPDAAILTVVAESFIRAGTIEPPDPGTLTSSRLASFLDVLDQPGLHTSPEVTTQIILSRLNAIAPASLSPQSPLLLRIARAFVALPAPCTVADIEKLLALQNEKTADPRERALVQFCATLAHPADSDAAAWRRVAEAGLGFATNASSDHRLPTALARACIAAQLALKENEPASRTLHIDCLRAATANHIQPEGTFAVQLAEALAREAAALAPDGAAPLLREIETAATAASLPVTDRAEMQLHALRARYAILDRLLRDPAEQPWPTPRVKAFAADCLAACNTHLDLIDPTRSGNLRALSSMDADLPDAMAVEASLIVGGRDAAYLRLEAWLAWAGKSMSRHELLFRERLYLSLLTADTKTLEQLRPDALDQLKPGNRANTLRMCSDRFWAIFAKHIDGFVGDPLPDDAAMAAKALALTNEWRNSFAEFDQPLAAERAAWGALFSGDIPTAFTVFSSIVATEKRVDPLRGLAESQLAKGDFAGAFTKFSTIAAATDPAKPGNAESESSKRNYFHAWARMLEVLDKQNTDASRTPTIQRESRRLLLLKPEQACPECHTRIRAIAEKYGV